MPFLQLVLTPSLEKRNNNSFELVDIRELPTPTPFGVFPMQAIYEVTQCERNLFRIHFCPNESAANADFLYALPKGNSFPATSMASPEIALMCFVLIRKDRCILIK